MLIVVSRHLELGFMLLGLLASPEIQHRLSQIDFTQNLTFVDEPKLATILDCVVIWRSLLK